MRALNTLLTVVGFAAIFAVLVSTSAVVTATIHKVLASAGAAAGASRSGELRDPSARRAGERIQWCRLRYWTRDCARFRFGWEPLSAALTWLIPPDV